MTLHYRQTIQRLFDKVRITSGVCSWQLRRAVTAHAVAWAGGPSPSSQDESLPPLLEQYLHKVTCHAYKITDTDVAGLRAAGHTEEEIFELTVCTALGASQARLDLGLSLLREGEA